MRFKRWLQSPMRFGNYTFHAEFRTVKEYDPATDTWTERAEMPTARAAIGVAQASDGLIYAVGGSDYGLSTDIYYDVVEAYTPPSFVPHSLYLPTGLRVNEVPVRR